MKPEKTFLAKDVSDSSGTIKVYTKFGTEVEVKDNGILVVQEPESECIVVEEHEEWGCNQHYAYILRYGKRYNFNFEYFGYTKAADYSYSKN